MQPTTAKTVTSNSATSSAINLNIKQATDELNWSELAFELELDALARQFALNSVVQSFRDSQLKLAFSPELEVMLNSDLEQQIKKAIEAKLGLSLNIEFISQPRLNVETPQQAGERKQEQARLRVIEDIQQDPVVQQLNTLFGAELIHQSVKKRNG